MALVAISILLTVLSGFMIVVLRRADQTSIVEVLICTSWSKSFLRQNLEDKKEEYIKKNEKYHSDSAKKIKKKLTSWDKQIGTYQDQEEKYISGRSFSIADMIPIFGYVLLSGLRLDGNSDIVRVLTRKCEFSGYVELERERQTNGKRNSALYAYYLLASLAGYLYIGLFTALFLILLSLWLERELSNVLVFALIGFMLPAIVGYLPLEELRVRAEKRQEEIDQDFPNILSKTALLVTAGMNIINALREAGESGNSVIYMEVRRVMKEIGEASTVSAAFGNLQTRCNNRYLDRMISVIIKSYSAGNSNLADDLREINRECWLEKKHQVRRMGETVQNKLFVPTMLMFVGILVVIILPAMSGFNF